MHFENTALEYIPVEDQDLIMRIGALLDSLLYVRDFVRNRCPEVSTKLVLTCHSISRFIAKHVPGLEVVDGYFYGLCPQENGPGFVIYTGAHSWLRSSSGKTIFDTYPVDCVAAGTVLAFPLDVPQKVRKSSSYGAAKYKECQIESQWFNLEETEKLTNDLDLFYTTWYPRLLEFTSTSLS